ncbi:Protein ELYS, partial [Ophiophagus hannah]
MRDLTAHVTSCLLQFPDVTIQALGEDEITLDCVLSGKFTGGRSGLACLACGPQLEIVSPITGERLSAYRFNGVNEQLPTILAVKEFSWQKRNGLLIGLEETEGSVLCLYDLGISRVVKAVVLPGRVTAIEPIINHGGASLTTQHLHQCLRWLFGVAVVVTDVGHVLLIDLCLDDLSCNQNEIEASDLEVITGIPSEIPQVRETVTRKGRHLCFQLLNPSGTAVTTLSYIQRSNQLVVGFSDGYLSLWNMKSLKKEYHFQLEGGRVPVYAVTFQEPENDPRNCCYLWAVQSTQESEGDILSLHLLQLAFSDRRRLASGQIMYEGLEYCEERYSLDLTGGVSSLRGQPSNTKLIGCQTIEKFRSHVDREDSINEVTSPDTSVSVFSWQVNTYGQGKPSTYLGIFDINRWYHAQMPDSLRPGEFLHNCPYFALWSLDAVVSITSPNHILDVLVHERSFTRGVPPSYPPPEQFFNPSTYNFDVTCLLNCGIVHMSCTGFQKDTLHFLKNSSCSLNETIPEGYNRCLIAGLLSPKFIDIQPTSLSQEEQFEAVLSTAIQTSSLGLLTSCIKQWTAEEQPDSAPNLRFVLEWAWSAPLFDGSSNFIDPQTLQSLQRCELLLSNLNTVLNCFIMEAQELTEKDLTNKQVVTSLLSQYLQVVIWFCRSNLLPENLEEDMHLPKSFYNYQHIQRFYISCRQKLERLSRGKWNPDCLMIDGMISQLGDSVALLDLYLLENTEELYKHAITIYLLLDIMHSCPNRTDTSVDSFPTAFAVPIGLVNLIQGFWCLDHNDYENSLSYLFHPATIKLPWQHMQIIQALICMVEAWNVLRQNSSQLKIEEMLKHVYEICQELGLMEDLLKLPFTETEQECLEKFLQTSTGINNHEFLLVHHLQRANYIPALQLNQSLKINLMVNLAKRIATGNVITKATFISNVLSKIGEVWAGSEQKTKSHQNDSGPEEQSSVLEPCPDRQLPDPFIGTPITKSLRKHSRLLDLMIQPISLDSPPLRRSQQKSPEVSASDRFSSPLHSRSQYSVKTLLPKNIARAPELKLLETPPVVKRAKALASTSSSVFPGFTPQSILRSSVRTTPLATPTASPRRSITPPLRAKETKISFMEESKTSQWTGETDHEINNANTSGYILEAQMEENWVKNRETSSISDHSLQEELEERDQSSECITSDQLNETKVSKEINDTGVKPTYITLECHDAKSVDFGNSNFMGSQQTTVSSGEIVDLPGSSEREVIESEPIMEQQTSANVDQSAESDEKDDRKCGSFPEDEVFPKAHLKVDQDTIVCFLPSNECSTHTLESNMLPLLEDNRFLAETNSQVQKMEGADGECSIPDSEDIASIHSKNELEEGEAIDESELEKTIQEEHLIVLQEKTLPNIDSENQNVDNTAEVLPYVPEPIQMAIAENLLDVIKDTRSKEFSAEIIEQSFHESISKKVLNLSKGPVQNVHDSNNDVDLNRIENLMPGISSTDHANQSLNISCNDQSLTKKNKPTILATPILRRSTRRAKKSTVISENLPHNSEEAQEQQILQIPDFPIKGVKETKNELEISANVHPVSPTFLANTTRSGIRKPNKSVSKPRSDLPSARQRTPRITRSVVGNQNSNQFIIDHTIQMTVTPKSATKLKAIALQLAENVISDQEVEPQGKQLSVSPKRGRRRKHGILKVVTQAETISEKLPSPSLVRKSRSRKTSLSETIFKHDMQPNESQLSEQGRIQRIGTSELISDQESGLIESSLTEPPRRKRGRPRKNSLNVSAESQLDLSLLSSPDAASSVHKRNTRSGAVQTLGCLPSLETSIMETPKRRSSRVTSRSVEKTDIEKSDLKECVIRPTEAVASEKKSENRRSRITRIRKKSTLPSVSETSREEEHLPLATDNEVESETTDVARLRLGEIEETLTHHADSIKRTRLTPKKVKQSLSLDINKTFFFSPPLTKLTAKTKGEKAVTPVQLKGIDSDLASKFVFSPPVLRSRKKQMSSISRIELPVKEEKHAVSVETLEKQNIKSRTTRILGKDSSWSPPAMEIKFISPFGTPADETKRKQGDSVDKTEKAVQKTVRRKEKRLSSYPKPVVRKKML